MSNKPRFSSERVNVMCKSIFPWILMIPNCIIEKILKEVLKYIHCTFILHNLLIEYSEKHLTSWERENARLSGIDIPKPENWIKWCQRSIFYTVGCKKTHQKIGGEKPLKDFWGKLMLHFWLTEWEKRIQVVTQMWI